MLGVNTSPVGHDVGPIVQAISLMLVVSIFVAAVNAEFFAIPAFLVSAVVMAGIGTGLVRHHRGADPPEKREAMVTAALAWAVIGVLGGLPFLLIAWTIHVDPFPAWANTSPMDPTTKVFLRPLDSIFESVSGFTGTGLTMAAVEDNLPRSIHTDLQTRWVFIWFTRVRRWRDQRRDHASRRGRYLPEYTRYSLDCVRYRPLGRDR